MNNEEKKPVEQVDSEQETVKEVKAAPKQESGLAGWWKSTSTGVKTAIIAGLSCLAVAVVVLCVVLIGGNNGPAGSGNGGGGGNGGGSGKTVSYSVTVVTKGGMPLAKLPVYIYEYEDGSLGDLADGGYGATNESGKVTFNLTEGKEYAAKIDNSVPDGYDVASSYPLVSDDMTITVSSAVIPESSLVGISYELGSVIRDFTVNSTILVEDENGDLVFKDQVFTLSEALEEKDAVLINFWYTTCSWCITEFPYMQKVYEQYSDDIAIIALDPYSDDTPSAIKNFQADMGLTFNVAQDKFGLSDAFKVEGYPTSVMIDRYGVVTLIEPGAITTERAFSLLFEYFTADNYEQKLIANVSELVPKEKPDVEMPSSEELSQIFDKGTIDGVTYLPYRDSASDDEKEYSWPFVIDQFDFEGELYDVIRTSNAFKESSFSQLLFDVDLNAGDVLAFDYFASTELGADILYVVVNGKDIYSISGEGTGWETCYAFVAEEDATYEVGLVYSKDSSDDVGNDTVYLKDLRIVSEADIDSPTYIFRYAATNPDQYSNYQDYITPVLGADGYYHVNRADGPILLVNLMGYTLFSEDNTVYYMAVDLYNENMITDAQYDKIIDYCSYASNSSIYGVSPVTPELQELLDEYIVYYYGDQSNENDWQRLCCYYDAYATGGKQLEDPIKGLSLFSAYDVILSNKGSTDFPNSFTYDRVIMPRGLLGKFTPTQSGTYLITSYAPDPNNEGYGLETNAWIFTENDFGNREAWYTYENVNRLNTTDVNNCYMIVYLEAGKDYYIDIAFYDVYQEGTINYRVERLGGEGYYRFSLASPGYFTTEEDHSGDMTSWYIHGGIDVVLGTDGIWREKRTDDRVGSIMYADFTMKTPIFSHSLAEMIELGAFNFSLSEGDQFILNYLAMNDNDAEKCDAYLRELWGDTYEDYAAIYQVQDVYNGVYHGEGQDYTELARSYYAKRIVAGYNAQLDETIAADDARIGCVVVTEELADLLQLLMDKYTFMNGDGEHKWSVENSWTKVCYYTQYFCAATPK